MKNIRITFQSSAAALLVFIGLDAAVEHLLYLTTGLSVVKYFRTELNLVLDQRFHIINLFLFSSEIILVMTVYGILRPKFSSKSKRVMVTVLIFYLFSILFIGQLVNLGIYPFKAAIAFAITTAITFPVATLTGAYVYEYSLGIGDKNGKN